MDFDQEDRAPMAASNRVIWGAVRGPGVPYPDLPGGGGDTGGAEDDG